MQSNSKKAKTVHNQELMSRLEKYVKLKGNNLTNFAMLNKISSSQMSNMKGGSDFGISVLLKILRNNTDLSAEYLTRGIGEIISVKITEMGKSVQKSTKPYPVHSSKTEELEKRIQSLESEIFRIKINMK